MDKLYRHQCSKLKVSVIYFNTFLKQNLSSFVATLSTVVHHEVFDLIDLVQVIVVMPCDQTPVSLVCGGMCLQLLFLAFRY